MNNFILSNSYLNKHQSDLTNILDVKRLNFSYNKSKITLKDISFSVKKGAFHGLIGGNGAGKSTLIKLLIKALNLKSGKILINGVDYYSKNSHKLVISYFPDNIQFPLGLSVIQYLKNEYQVISKKDYLIKNRIFKLLKYFKIIDLANKNPNQLSSGQKKKVELIRIILEEPDLLILDEPTNFLDPQGRKVMFECLTYLNQKGSTIIISSHILQELKHYIDSATIIDDGKIMFSGATHGDEIIEIYDKISKPFNLDDLETDEKDDEWDIPSFENYREKTYETASINSINTSILNNQKKTIEPPSLPSSAKLITNKKTSLPPPPPIPSVKIQNSGIKVNVQTSLKDNKKTKNENASALSNTDKLTKNKTKPNKKNSSKNSTINNLKGDSDA